MAEGEFVCVDIRLDFTQTALGCFLVDRPIGHSGTKRLNKSIHLSMWHDQPCCLGFKKLKESCKLNFEWMCGTVARILDLESM
jgi:hypothetical protein